MLFRPALFGVFCTVVVWSIDSSVSSEDLRLSFDDLPGVSYSVPKMSD